jgi:hypothetical protein
MRKMTLLATAFLMTLAAASAAKPLYASHVPPLPTCWILICDADGVCIAEHTYCPPGT